MKIKILVMMLILVGCEKNYPGIPSIEFEKLLDSCDTGNISRERLSDNQLLRLSIRDKECKNFVQPPNKDMGEEFFPRGLDLQAGNSLSPI